MFSPSKSFKKKKIAHENMRKPASKVAQIQPKSQFLFHKNLPPWDFSLMTLPGIFFGPPYFETALGQSQDKQS